MTVGATKVTIVPITICSATMKSVSGLFSVFQTLTTTLYSKKDLRNKKSEYAIKVPPKKPNSTSIQTLNYLYASVVDVGSLILSFCSTKNCTDKMSTTTWQLLIKIINRFETRNHFCFTQELTIIMIAQNPWETSK